VLFYRSEKTHGDHPVGQVAQLGHFHGAQHGQINMAAENLTQSKWPGHRRDLDLPSDHRKAVVASEIRRPRNHRHSFFPGVDEVRIYILRGGEGPEPQNAILGLEEDLHVVGNVIGGEHRHPDSQIRCNLFCTETTPECPQHLPYIPSLNSKAALLMILSLTNAPALFFAGSLSPSSLLTQTLSILFSYFSPFTTLSTKIPGKCTSSGLISPTFTISSTSAIVTFAALAIAGLKFLADLLKSVCQKIASIPQLESHLKTKLP
jgi:hypothetical protein